MVGRCPQHEQFQTDRGRLLEVCSVLGLPAQRADVLSTRQKVTGTSTKRPERNKFPINIGPSVPSA